MVNDYLKKFWI